VTSKWLLPFISQKKASIEEEKKKRTKIIIKRLKKTK